MVEIVPLLAYCAGCGGQAFSGRPASCDGCGNGRWLLLNRHQIAGLELSRCEALPSPGDISPRQE